MTTSMAGMRQQLSWLVRGRANTERVLAALTADLQALQQKVDALDRRLGEVALSNEAVATRQLDGFDAIRVALGEAVDDLTERIAALRSSVA